MLEVSHEISQNSIQMDIHNISKVLGPTIVGHSTSEPGAGELLSEGTFQKSVMKALL